MNESVSDRQIPTYEQISAGGVVYRTVDAGIEIMIVQVVPELRWQLPKGVIDAGETREQAALREVREEAGVDAELVEFLDTSEYWFTDKARRTAATLSQICSLLSDEICRW